MGRVHDILVFLQGLSMEQIVMAVVIIIVIPLISSIVKATFQVFTDMLWIGFKTFCVLLTVFTAATILFPETVGGFVNVGIIGIADTTKDFVKHLVGSFYKQAVGLIGF